MNLNQALGMALRELRISNGLSQETLGLSQTFISDVERGKKSLTIGKLEELCATLGIDPAVLVIRASLIKSPNQTADQFLEAIRHQLDNT